MNPIEKLTQHFKEFPGIGERQAKRFVYFLLHKNPGFVDELSNEIKELKKNIIQCNSCFLFFPTLNKDIDFKNKLCDVCNDTRTDHSSLLIVEKDADYENIKKSCLYKGMYFILGGTVPIVTKETPSFIKTKELLKTIENRCNNDGLKEVILALSVNPASEHTDMYLRQILNELQKKYDLKIVSLGRGLSTGTELEYSDNETIKNALQNRH